MVAAFIWSKRKWLITGLFCIALVAVQAQTTDSAISAAQRQANWQKDLRYLVSGLSAPGDMADEYGPRTRGQKDFAKLYAPASFNTAIEALKQNVPRLSNDEIALRLMRLDTHPVKRVVIDLRVGVYSLGSYVQTLATTFVGPRN